MQNSYIYSASDINNNFEYPELQRGNDYAKQRRVTNLVIDNMGVLTALVRGTASKPYQVEIQITKHKRTTDFDGYCTCPVGFDCKHIVAALFAGLDYFSPLKTSIQTPTNNTQMLDYETQKWLTKLSAKDGDIVDDNKQLTYIISPPTKELAFSVSAVFTYVLKNGFLSSINKKINVKNINYPQTQYLTDLDQTIIKLIGGLSEYYIHYYIYEIPAGEASNLLLNLLIQTGRCYLEAEKIHPNDALTMGETQKATIEWQVNNNGNQKTQLKVENIQNPIILSLTPPHYICPYTKKIGLIENELPAKQLALLLRAPEITPEHSELFHQKLANILPDLPAALPKIIPLQKQQIPPISCLKLCSTSIQAQKSNGWKYYPQGAPIEIPTVQLRFQYANKKVNWEDKNSEIKLFKDNELHIITRDISAENKQREYINKLGISLILNDIDNSYNVKSSDTWLFTNNPANKKFTTNQDTTKFWNDFMQNIIPKLKEQGWKIEISANFPYNIVHADDEWYSEIEEVSGIDWFGVELGVNIEGKKLNLIPIILKLLKTDQNIFDNIDKLSAQEPLLITLDDGRRLALPPKRAEILLSILKNLFSYKTEIDKNGRLKMQSLDSALLAEMEMAADSLNMRWFGGEKIRELGKKLKEFSHIESVNPPKEFKGELRHYQQEGLSWLQFLREYNLAGILADDMGLGKTVQVLAHIATEKSNKRLKHPFLVIAPTSLMSNWKAEAERFAPNLKVLTLHGNQRKEYFKDIKKHDLILTTYPLLPRDKDILLANEYNTIILDEAQTIKNSRAKLTQIACQLKSQHRLCMTGTPLENNLGELWSLFNFLLPGYLGTSLQFNRLFRNPIEKQGDVSSAQTLSRRIKPFILRRTKQEVATELPPKTEIIRMVELEGEQRDLYETIRISMYDKIRKEIATHGMGKSHIIVLDALLKLRQVCCDPSLLKIDIAKNITKSSKNEELMDMLIQMVKEGRKILLFSQFTSMLSILENQLKKENITYAKLTGQTIDRETQINNFQNGNVPLFLISLKAGGTGLNLTAADTVIHYDPWWNPAAENQATDRAYRIGQDKPVFVYKLITTGTVEEKILEMQEKKRALMDNIFDATGNSSSKLTTEDIQILFEPI